MALAQQDPELHALIARERERQQDGIELIPSENYVSPAVLEAMGTILTNKYSEGYPGRRYYGGNEIVDEIEKVAQLRARELFGVPYANVQPYSGSPANLAVYLATCRPGDPIMGHNLPDGGHLTHGQKVSATGIYYDSHPYHVQPDGYIDFDDVWRVAREHKPKLIWCGGTAYAREYPFAKFAEVADEVGAYFAADVAHIAGLIVGGAHPSPTPHVHIITTTTHKTLRGPRGAMIMITERGIAKDDSLPEKIDKAVFPGLQGGPHDHTTAAIAVALGEAMKPEFTTYAGQVVRNAKALGAALLEQRFTLVTGGTDNHLLLVDLTSEGIGRGVFMQEALDAVGITVNKNTIPNEPSSPFYPSGIRCGTPAATTRGLRESDMAKIAAWMAAVRDEASEFMMPQDRAARTQVLRHFRDWVGGNDRLKSIHEEVKTFCRRFPVPGIA